MTCESLITHTLESIFHRYTRTISARIWKTWKSSVAVHTGVPRHANTCIHISDVLCTDTVLTSMAFGDFSSTIITTIIFVTYTFEVSTSVVDTGTITTD